MPGASLLTLLDDISTVWDDVATMTKVDILRPLAPWSLAFVPFRSFAYQIEE